MEVNILDSVKNSFFLSEYTLDISKIKIKHFPKNSFVTDEIAGNSYVVLVHSGVVSVYFTTIDGREIHLNNLKKGDCFGISNLVDEHELKTTLRCKNDCVLLYIPKSDVINCMKNSTEFALKYAAYCNKKINFLFTKFDFVTTDSARCKLIKYILTYKNDEDIVDINGNREDLASNIGISRASLFRELSFLTENKLISTKSHFIYILNTQKLVDILKGE